MNFFLLWIQIYNKKTKDRFFVRGEGGLMGGGGLVGGRGAGVRKKIGGGSERGGGVAGDFF